MEIEYTEDDYIDIVKERWEEEVDNWSSELVESGHGQDNYVEVNACQSEDDQTLFDGFLTAEGKAKAGHARAGTRVSPLERKADARASGVDLEVNYNVSDGLLEANLKTAVAEAQAEAGVGLAKLGAYAEASANTTKIESEFGAFTSRYKKLEESIQNGDREVDLATVGELVFTRLTTPSVKVAAKGPGADAEAGVSVGYTGANIGAYAAEAKAGPFGVRAGLKFGAGIRNGIPEVDLGPVTACVVQ